MANILAELKGAFMSVLLFSLLGIEFPVPGSNISHGLKSLKYFFPDSLGHFGELTMIRPGPCTLQDLATESPVPSFPCIGDFLLHAVYVFLCLLPLALKHKIFDADVLLLMN